MKISGVVGVGVRCRRSFHVCHAEFGKYIA